MNKLILIALATASVASIAAPAMAKDTDYVGNGSYFVYVYPGHLPHVTGDNPGAQFTSTEADQLQYLDEDCHKQFDHMRPSMLKSVGLTALRNVPGVVAGTVIAAPLAFPGVAGIAKTYGIFESGPALGGSLGAGITGHEYGKHYLQGTCMDAAVSEAKRAVPGALRGIRIIIDAFPVYGHRMKRPTGPGTPDFDMGTATPADKAAAEKAAQEDTTNPKHL